MEYTKKYSADDLFDMFANQADFAALANKSVFEVREQLIEMAPDMEDSRKVAHIIKAKAHDLAYPNG
jgi:hypothetical protein